MSVHDEGLVVGAKVLDSCDLDLDHLELLLGCTSTDIQIVVDVLNVQDYELRETVTTAKRCEFVLPISVLVYFIGPHGENINDLHKS